MTFTILSFYHFSFYDKIKKKSGRMIRFLKRSCLAYRDIDYTWVGCRKVMKNGIGYV